MNRLIISIFSLTVALIAFAGDIMVTVTPRQQTLPPQAALYVKQPYDYFNVTLLNTTDRPQQIYLGLTLQQLTPSRGLTLPLGGINRPDKPFVVPARATSYLSAMDMRTIFGNGGLNSILGGMSNLLPEGDYEAQITAYAWDASMQSPVALSDPNSGKCTFSVCYQAKAPQFLTPQMSNFADLDRVALLNRSLPQFTWTAPVIGCNLMGVNFRYHVKIVELLEGQSPIPALENNPVVFQTPQPLASTMCQLPQALANRLDPSVTYVAQVTATTGKVKSSYLNYVMIDNDGKSPYCLFRIADQSADNEK